MEQGQLTDENLSQGDLTQEELVLLNNLMYIQDNKRKIRSDITNYEGKTLKKFIQDYSSNNYEKIDELPEGATDTTHKEWKAMIEKIRQDDKLMNLKITDKLNDDKGGNAVCLEDPNNHDKATVVFRGTGKYEWIDNGIGGYSTMSNQQKEVINWVNSLPYKEITSSGHSKGGNKSMLVAILCPNVVRCVALDGQGFSPEFYDEYIDEINKNKDKITLICSQGDYVNGLFINIAGNTVYTQSDESYSERILSHGFKLDLSRVFLLVDLIGLGREHCPTTLLDFKDGQVSLRDIAENNQKDPIARLIHEYVVYVNENAKLEDRKYLFSLLMNMLQGEEQKIDVALPDCTGNRALDIILWLINKIKDPEIGCPDGFVERMKTLSEDWIESLNMTTAQKDKFHKLMKKYLLGYGLSDSEIKELNDLLAGIHGQEEVLNGLSASSLKRDFSKAAKEKLINYIKDVEGDNPLYFKKWPQWEALDSVRARLSVEGCHGFIDDYYNYLIDKNNESIKKINDIFERVYETDKEYGDNLRKVCNKLEEVQKSIIKVIERYDTGKVQVDLSVLQVN